MITKQTTLLKEIAFKYHPIYSKTSLTYQRQHLSVSTKAPKSIGIENIIEESLSYIGGYDFIDAKSQDFNDVDKSDSKTGTVNIKSRMVEIGGIGNKIGALRITIWNPILDTVDFMFIPHALWKYVYANKCYGKNTENKLRLQMTWNQEKNHYNKFEIFRLPSFTDLATMTEEKFYNLHPEFEHLRLKESSISLPDHDSVDLTKTDPSEQISIPYIEGDALSQIEDLQGIQPISLYD